jgi:hypothetical protein
MSPKRPRWELTGYSHGTIFLLIVGQMPLVQALVAKTTFLALKVPLGVCNREYPTSSRLMLVTGVLVWRFTAFRSISLAAS